MLELSDAASWVEPSKIGWNTTTLSANSSDNDANILL
jgi:hypothetical protein